MTDFFEELTKAKKNFPLNFAYPPREFIESLFQVKLAALRVNFKLSFLEKPVFEAMEGIILKGIKGDYDKFFDLTMIQGGAGTSLNMAANEIIARFSSEILNEKVSPYEHANLHQSTNDVIPTAVKITLMKYAKKLEEAILKLLRSLEKREKDFDKLVKPGLTQMMYAVPVTLGREFSAYASAISRDRWRIFKIIERVKEVNLGGTAIGTGFKAPKKYIFNVVNELKSITGLPVARAENLVDATQNADVFVEVSGILSACASNLFKISGDLRFLSSSPVNQLILEKVQTGSSIMPGKVNPVIPEFVQSCAIKVQANHNIVQTSASLGNLELNPFLPLIGYALFEDFSLLEKSCEKLSECIDNLKPNFETFNSLKTNDYVVLFAYSTIAGYEKARDVFLDFGKERKKEKETGSADGMFYKYLLESGLAEKEDLDKALNPENLLKMGF